MIRIVNPMITSLVGRTIESLEVLVGLLQPGAARILLPLRRSIVTVDKPVGAGQPNQETDVLLVRLMLNLVAATDARWKDRFDKPLPHEPKFDAELGKRIRLYQQEGGFQITFTPPEPQQPTALVGNRIQRVGSDGNLCEPPQLTAKEPLFVDGIIDPCRADSDRGSRSKLVYTIVHLNYHLLFKLRALQTMRLAPKLMKMIDHIGDPKLAPLREELDRAEPRDPNRPPRPEP